MKILLVNRYGYKHIVLSENGKRKTYTVHKLVALAFIPNPDNKETVNHKDGVKSNCKAKNLEWATHKEQKEHAIRNGLCNKNVDALKESNILKSRKVIFRGEKYNSINEAKRKNGVHQRVVAREGAFI